MRAATATDFKQNAIIYNQYGEWKLLRKYDNGIWEARGKSGEKCVFEGEAKFYQVKD